MQQRDKENLLKLGQRVKELRLKKSQSLNKFVFNQSGITSSTWSRIENGKFNIKFSTLISIAAMLNISLEELIKGIDFEYILEE